MFGDGEIHSLTKAGIVFLVFLVIAIIVYALLSPITTILFDSFENANWGNAESEKTWVIDGVRQACTIMFAIFISLPMTWFIFWVFHREPRYTEYDYNQWR